MCQNFSRKYGYVAVAFILRIRWRQRQQERLSHTTSGLATTSFETLSIPFEQRRRRFRQAGECRYQDSQPFLQLMARLPKVNSIVALLAWSYSKNQRWIRYCSNSLVWITSRHHIYNEKIPLKSTQKPFKVICPNKDCRITTWWQRGRHRLNKNISKTISTHVSYFCTSFVKLTYNILTA